MERSEWKLSEIEIIALEETKKNNLKSTIGAFCCGYEKAQEMLYTEEELFKIINDFCFDWNYNYKGELSQKQYLIEWFEKFKKK
jgi:hypothetical protein